MEPEKLELAAIAAANLRGTPHFDEFLGYLDEVKEDFLGRLTNPDDIGNHAAMAYLAGGLEVIRRLTIDTGAEDPST